MYELQNGEIIFYENSYDNPPLKRYKFKDTALISYSEEFSHSGETPMIVRMTMSPAIQDYGKLWVKSWHENWVEPNDANTSAIHSNESESPTQSNLDQLPNTVLAPLTNEDLILLNSDLDNVDLLNQFIEKPELVDAWGMLKSLGEESLKIDSVWLKRVSDWDSVGIQFTKEDDKLKLIDASGNIFGEFKNENLLPNKYVNVGVLKGDIINGYQLVESRGNLGFKRIPDKSPYSASELTMLTQHPNAHVLERHSFDVTDDSLIKRANEGIAPDGSRIGRRNRPPVKPPHSSKFENSSQLKLALENTKPGTLAFNSVGVDNGVKVVTHELFDGTMYGKGVPKNGNTFIESTKVRAVYREVSPNNFQLLTMFPDF